MLFHFLLAVQLVPTACSTRLRSMTEESKKVRNSLVSVMDIASVTILYIIRAIAKSYYVSV